MRGSTAHYENLPLESASAWGDSWLRHRYLLFHLVGSDLRSRYRRSYLGIFWALLWPVAFSAIFATVAVNIFDAPFGEYVIYVVTGFVLWDFLAGAISGGAQCFQVAEGYMRQTRLPYLVFAIRCVSTLAVNFAFGSLAAAIVIIAGTPQAVAYTWLLWPFVTLAAFLFALPCAVISGIAHLKFRDYQHGIGLALFIMWYLSPVLISREIYNSPSLSLFSSMNPIASFCDMFRAIMMYRALPDLYDIALVSTYIVGLWIVAFGWFASERDKLVHWM